MASILKEKWLWIIIIGLIAILVMPFVIVWFILALPAPFNMVAAIGMVLGWGVVAGYKDWVMSEGRKKTKTYESC